MKCPADGNTLEEQQDDGITYHQCPACEGMWMRHRALRTLVRKANPSADIVLPSPQDAYRPGKSSDIDTNEITNCPLDGAEYYEHSFGSVMIDICPRCDGVWLDKGELSNIRKALNEGGVSSIIAGTLLNDVAAYFGSFFNEPEDE